MLYYVFQVNIKFVMVSLLNLRVKIYKIEVTLLIDLYCKVYSKHLVQIGHL